MCSVKGRLAIIEAAMVHGRPRTRRAAALIDHLSCHRNDPPSSQTISALTNMSGCKLE